LIRGKHPADLRTAYYFRLTRLLEPFVLVRHYGRNACRFLLAQVVVFATSVRIKRTPPGRVITRPGLFLLGASWWWHTFSAFVSSSSVVGTKP
jgi:hypothetical protein